MELFSLILLLPFTFALSVLYRLFLKKLINPSLFARKISIILSVAILLLFFVEILLVYFVGFPTLKKINPKLFYIIHLVNIFMIVPGILYLYNVLLKQKHWFFFGIMGSIISFIVLLYHIYIFEQLFGMQ